MKYTIEFYAINVNEQRFDFLGSTTSYKGLNFADRLNDHGGAMFSLNLLDPTCNTRLIKRFVNQVVIKRGNSVRFVGPIINYSGTYDDTGGYLDIECGSYLYHLNSRYTDDLVTYTGEEQSDICWDLIDTVQSRDNGYLGIEEGGLTATGVDRDRTYEYYPVSQALTNLADVINGMDFSFSAQLDGDNKLEKILFNTHYPLGSLRTNLPPLKIGENIKLKTFKSNSNLHNYATAIGAGLVDPITSIKENTALQKAYTRRESIINRTKNAGHKCILTGTPIGKHAGDLYFQFQFLDPAILNYNSYADFSSAHLLYGGREGKIVVAYSNIEEISKRISPYTVTMSRSEMGIDREKLYQIEPYKITNREKYNELKEKYEKYYEQNMSNAILGYMVKLQQCANGYELNEEDEVIGYSDNGRIECLKSLLKKHSEKQIVIYFKYNEDLKDLSKALDIPILSGKTKTKNFDDVIYNFNSGEYKIIALQQQLSIGFSLRSADIMIYYSRKFGSISSAQSEDRACESIEKTLTIIDICAKNTIDEIIKSTINKQFDIINLFKTEIKK